MSLFFGRRREKFDDDREENYRSFGMANTLHDKFMQEYGTVICKEIHCKIFGRSYYLWDSEEKQAFEEAGAHKDKCTTVVANAAAWSTGAILDEIEKMSLEIKDFNHLKCIMD